MGAKRYHGHATYCGDESSYRSRFSMLSATCIGMLIPHDRPFVDGFGYAFMSHAPDSSFPVTTAPLFSLLHWPFFLASPLVRCQPDVYRHCDCLVTYLSGCSLAIRHAGCVSVRYCRLLVRATGLELIWGNYCQYHKALLSHEFCPTNQ